MTANTREFADEVGIGKGTKQNWDDYNGLNRVGMITRGLTRILMTA